jgi:hypothetical protein
MNSAVVSAPLGVMGFGFGLVAALVTRRYGPTLVGGCLAVGGLYLLYILVTGEGASFVPYVMLAGAVGSAVLLAGFALGVGFARRLERRARTP